MDGGIPTLGTSILGAQNNLDNKKKKQSKHNTVCTILSLEHLRSLQVFKSHKLVKYEPTASQPTRTDLRTNEQREKVSLHSLD